MRKPPHCMKCKGVNDLVVSSRKVKNDKEFVYYYCRTCYVEKYKKYRKANRDKVNSYVYKSIKRYPEKQAARYKLNRAIKNGIIERPSLCFACKEKKRVEGHHFDYSKPLEVTWLCRRCHALEHKK